jgi:hypothetical protein
MEVTSAPFSSAPAATAFAIASVLPVPLQKTTATLLILTFFLSFALFFGCTFHLPAGGIKGGVNLLIVY